MQDGRPESPGTTPALEAAHRVGEIAAAYDRVVIGSGDGIFLELACELRRAGLVVGVVSRADALAIDLRGGACLVCRIPAGAVVA